MALPRLPTLKACAGCEHFRCTERNSDDDTYFAGQCRRNPPTGHQAQWTRVYAEDWCGEFLEKGKPFL